MDLNTFLMLALAAFLFATSPGPGTLAVLSTSTRSGFRAGFFLSLGEVMGDLLYLTVALFSLGIMASFLSPVMSYVKIFGALYLIYLGYKQFTSPAVDVVDSGSTRSDLRQVMVGFLIAGTNPKVIVFYLSFLPLFVNLEGISLLYGVQVAATIGVTVLVGLTVINILGQQLRRLVAKPRFAKRLNQVTGSIMIGVGLAVAKS